MSLFLKPLELALGHALRFDSESHRKLQNFNDRNIRIDITDIKMAIFIRFTNMDIRLSTPDQDVADLMIKSNSFTLLNLLHQPESLFSNQIQIMGDVQFAKQLQDWLKNFDFDWEAQLARYTGDTLAYPIARTLRQTFDWFNYNRSELANGIAEYLREESLYLPDKAQTERFMKTVDQLRTDTDRLEARIRKLQHTVENKI